MKNIAQGQGQGQGTARLYPIYRTRLGDAIFPGTDAFTIQLRNQFSEMLSGHLEAGRQHSVIAFGESLSEFTPFSVKDAGGEWKARLLDRWEKEQRPLIFLALEDFFLNGGYETRVKMQSDFMASLLDAGVQIEGATTLMDELAFSGDWHAAFVKLALMGRPIGIRLSASNGCDRKRIAAAAISAGFQEDQFARITCSI